jgi:hypothetical protein
VDSRFVVLATLHELAQDGLVYGHRAERDEGPGDQPGEAELVIS